MIFRDSLSEQDTQKDLGIKPEKIIRFFDVKMAVLDQQILITVGMATKKVKEIVRGLSRITTTSNAF